MKECVGMFQRSVRPNQRACATGTFLSVHLSGNVRAGDENVLRAPVANHASRFGLDDVDDAEH